MTFSVMTDVPNPLFDGNGNPFSGAVLKAFLPGTTTGTSIALDSAGSSPQASITYNSEGKLEVTGNEILPYIDKTHKWGIFANATDAGNNTPFYMGPFDNVEQQAATSQVVQSFDTVSLMVASITLSLGDIVGTAGYTSNGDGGDNTYQVVAAGTGTVDGGGFIDLPNTIPALQAKGLFPGNHYTLPQWGAVANTGSTTAIQAALSSSNDGRTLILDGLGLTYVLTTGLIFTNARTQLINFKFSADNSWVSGTIDYTDMGAANTSPATAQQILNRGNPMIRLWRDDTALSGEDFRDCAINNFELLCNDVAPGISCDGVRKTLISDGEITHQKGYGLAWSVKNTESSAVNVKVFEDDFDGPKQSDPLTNPYNSAGIVQTCADVVLSKCVSNYSQFPLWVDGYFNSQMSDMHLYNGNGVAADLPNAYFGPDAHRVANSNIYLDNGFIEMHSFDNSFVGGVMNNNLAATPNKNFARLHAQVPSDGIQGLVITDILGGSSMEPIALIEDGGNAFSGASNSLVTQTYFDSGTPQDRSTYLSGKQVQITVVTPDWVVAASVFKFDIDLSGEVISPNIATRVTVDFTDKRGTLTTVRNFWYNWGINETGKILTVFSDIALPCEVNIEFNDGFNYVS